MDIPKTMWVLRLHGPGLDNLVLEEVPTPRPGFGQLLARVDAGNYLAAVGGLDSTKQLIERVRAQGLEGKGVIYPHARGPLEAVDHWDGARERQCLQAHRR